MQSFMKPSSRSSGRLNPGAANGARPPLATSGGGVVGAARTLASARGKSGPKSSSWRPAWRRRRRARRRRSRGALQANSAGALPEPIELLTGARSRAPTCGFGPARNQRAARSWRAAPLMSGRQISGSLGGGGGGGGDDGAKLEAAAVATSAGDDARSPKRTVAQFGSAAQNLAVAAVALAAPAAVAPPGGGRADLYSPGAQIGRPSAGATPTTTPTTPLLAALEAETANHQRRRPQKRSHYALNEAAAETQVGVAVGATLSRPNRRRGDDGDGDDDDGAARDKRRTSQEGEEERIFNQDPEGLSGAKEKEKEKEEEKARRWKENPPHADKAAGCALFDHKPYVIYSALGSFYIPMLVMIFFYSRIYLVASRAQRALRRGYMTTKWPASSVAAYSNARGAAAAAAGSPDNGHAHALGATTGLKSGAPERVTLRIHRREKGATAAVVAAAQATLELSQLERRSLSGQQRHAPLLSSQARRRESPTSGASLNVSKQASKPQQQQAQPSDHQAPPTEQEFKPSALIGEAQLIRTQLDAAAAQSSEQSAQQQQPLDKCDACKSSEASAGSSQRRRACRRRQRKSRNRSPRHHDRNSPLSKRRCRCAAKHQRRASKVAGQKKQAASVVSESEQANGKDLSGVLQPDSASGVLITVSQYNETRDELQMGAVSERSRGAPEGEPSELSESSAEERQSTCFYAAPAQENEPPLSSEQAQRTDRSLSCTVSATPTIVVSWKAELGASETQLWPPTKRRESGESAPTGSASATANDNCELTPTVAPSVGGGGGGSQASSQLSMVNQVRKQSIMLLTSLTARSSQTLRRLSMAATTLPVSSLLSRSKSRDESNSSTDEWREMNSERRVRMRKQPKRTIDDYLMKVAGVDGSSEEEEEGGEEEEEDEEDGGGGGDSLSIDDDEDLESAAFSVDEEADRSLRYASLLLRAQCQDYQDYPPKQLADSTGPIESALSQTAQVQQQQELSNEGEAFEAMQEAAQVQDDDGDKQRAGREEPRKSCAHGKHDLASSQASKSVPPEVLVVADEDELGEQIKPPEKPRPIGAGLHRQGARYERATSRTVQPSALESTGHRNGGLVGVLTRWNEANGTSERAATRDGSARRLLLDKVPAVVVRRYGAKRTSRWHAKRLHAETKAAKTVAIIIGGFIFCWLPFFTAYLSRAIACASPDCVPHTMLSLFTWLGYTNSAINPLIYGLFSADFRHAFRNILCRCRLRSSNDDTVLVYV